MAGGGGQGAEVGGRVGVQGAVGGPEQARVAVAFGLAGDPPGEVAQVPAGAGSGWDCGACLPGSSRAVTAAQSSAAVGAQRPDVVVGLAVGPGGRGQDVAAGGAEVQVAAGQVAVALRRSGEVGVQPAAGGADVGGRAVEQPGLGQAGECGVAVAGRAVIIDVQDVGSGGAGGDGQVPVRVAARTMR